MNNFSYPVIKSQAHRVYFSNGRVSREISKRLRAPVCENLDVAISLMKTKHKKVFGVILRHFNVFTSVYPSQETIARITGYTRSVVIDALADLRSLGLISSERFFNASCEYKIDDRFKDPIIRKKYAHIFAALLLNPISLLLANSGMDSRTPPNLNQSLYNISKSSYIKYLSIPAQSILIPEPVISARARTSNGSGTGFKKSEAVMSNPTSIRKSIQDLKQLDLTLYGQIRLSVFPERAIEYGKKKIEFSVASRDKFALFWTICRDYCKDNGLDLDWKEFDRLKEELGYPDGCLMSNLKPGISGLKAHEVSSKGESRGPQRTRWTPEQQIAADASAARCAEVKRRKEERWIESQKAKGIEVVQSPAHNPFSEDIEERKAAILNIPPAFRDQLLRLGLSQPADIFSNKKKLMIISALAALKISLDGLITQENLDKLIESATISHGASLAEFAPHQEYLNELEDASS